MKKLCLLVALILCGCTSAEEQARDIQLCKSAGESWGMDLSRHVYCKQHDAQERYY